MNKYYHSPLKEITNELIDTQTFPVKSINFDRVVNNANSVLTGIYSKNIQGDIQCNIKDMSNKIYNSPVKT